MRFLAALFILMSVSVSYASPWIAGSFGIRFENDSESGQLETRNPYGIIVGHRWTSNEVFAEFNTFSKTTGNSTLEIKRKSQIGLAGYRYYPFEIQSISWYPYLSSAVGGSREIIQTRFLGQTDERESKITLVGSAGIGVWGLIVNHFRTGAEFRFLASQEFSPNVMFDLSVRLGFEF
jgi:hypothetical protein